jgi:hypothetical protein
MPYSQTHAHRQADHSQRTGLRLEPFPGVFYNTQDSRTASAFIASSTEAGTAARHATDVLAGLPPHHVLRLVLPSPEACDPGESGRLLRAWLSRGVLRADTRPALYAYEQQDPSGATLRGVIGALRGGPHPHSGVAPHEDVSAHVVDRLVTTLAGLRADVEPLMLWYRGTGTMAATLSTAAERPALLEAVTGHGTAHRLWTITDEREIAAVQDELAAGHAVIADGHHRFSAHTRLREQPPAPGRPTAFWDHSLALLVDTEQHPMTPRAFHHVIRDLPLATALRRLGPAHPYEVCEGTLPSALARLAARRDDRVALLSDGARHCLTHLGQEPGGTGLTDAELAARHLLPRLRSDSAVDSEPLGSAVDAVAQAARAGGCAVLLNPPGAADIHRAALAGRRLPRKSTYFPLKPPLGLVMRVHTPPESRPPKEKTMSHPSPDLTAKHDAVHVVVAPPRTASTAFARVLWNNPAVGYYAHEPFEAAYFDGHGPEHAWESVRNAVDLSAVVGAKAGNSLLIKEIAFQAGDRIGELLAVATSVPVFLIRDPRLTISSRREVKRRAGSTLEFPLAETGWQALESHIAYCRDNGIDYVLVDAYDFRSQPASVMSQVSARLGVDFDPAQLTWEPRPDLTLSNHRTSGVDHFFTRVLNSKGIEPPMETVPDLAEFPEDGGLRAHVSWALDLYEQLRRDPKRIVPQS